MRKFLYPIFFLFILVLFSGCEKNQSVITGVDEREANVIIVFLDSKGIKAKKVVMPTSGMGGEATAAKFLIEVAPKDVVTAMAFLNQNGLPKKQGITLLELFAKSGLMSSDKEENIRYQAGLEQQITNTIMMIDGVIDAAIQISFPQQEAGTTSQQKITAACYIKHQGIIDDPNSHLENKIKRLISGAINGLDINDVTVVSDRSRFTDISPIEFKQVYPDKSEYINIWSMALAKDSITKFRVMFFSLMLFVFLFALMTGWLLWKIYPTIRKHGLKSLFQPQPLNLEKESSETSSEEIL